VENKIMQGKQNIEEKKKSTEHFRAGSVVLQTSVKHLTTNFATLKGHGSVLVAHIIVNIK